MLEFFKGRINELLEVIRNDYMVGARPAIELKLLAHCAHAFARDTGAAFEHQLPNVARVSTEVVDSGVRIGASVRLRDGPTRLAEVEAQPLTKRAVHVRLRLHFNLICQLLARLVCQQIFTLILKEILIQ